MGILSDFLGLWSNSGGYESESVKRRKSLRNRICRIEEIEPREMLSATPYEPPELINVGVVFHEDYYVEQNYEDEGGDTFYVSWYGGADGTTLTELVIDLNVYDFSESLYFFADHEQPKGAYNTDPFGFTVSNDSEIIHSSYSLEGDGLLTKLTICFEAGKFTSGKQFIFKIDVNSYSNTTGDVESVLGGEHFKGSTIDAKFESENYKMLEVNGTFENIYDVPPELRVPLDQYDETSGQRNITAGAIEQATERQIPKEGSISGYVYKDKNNNGQKNNGENGIADVELTLWVWNENDEIYESLGTTRTDEQGQYRFGELDPFKKYKITESQPKGYADGDESIGTINGNYVGNKESPDAIINIQIGANEHGENYNFGELKKGSISGYVYNDKNDDGQKDVGENGIAGVELTLWVWNETDEKYESLKTIKTDEQGQYRFGGLDPFKKYKITETQPTNYADGKETVGYFGKEINTVGDASEDNIISDIVLPFAGKGVNYNFGELERGSIEGYVYEDEDNDGYKDDNEKGIEGITIWLCEIDENGNKIKVGQTTTDKDGYYYFGELEPGKIYCVTEIEPEGYCDGKKTHVGTIDDDEHGSWTETENGSDQIEDIKINNGDNGINYNFAENRKGSLSGYVYEDKNGNGQKDEDETGIENVTLSLWVWDETQSEYINTTKTTTTASDGSYSFEGLCPFKTYQICEEQPTGYDDGKESVGTINGNSVGATTEEDDKIFNIELPPAGEGINYNFAEIKKVDTDPDDPDPQVPDPDVPDPDDPDPQVPDPDVPDPLTPPIPSSSVPYVPSYGARSGGVAGASPSWQPPLTGNGMMTGYGSGAVMTPAESAWHLSVINGGYPRDLEGPEAVADGIVASDSATRQTMILRGADTNGDASNGMRLVSVAWEPLPMDQSVWYVRGKNGVVQRLFKFGPKGGKPIVGDFNGDGIAEVAVFHDGKWYIDLNGNGVWDEGDLWAELGNATDQPIVGDWDGDGKTDIGVFGKKWSGDNEIIATESGLPSDLNTMESEAIARPKNIPPAVDVSKQLQSARAMKHSQNGAVRLDVIDHVFEYGEEGDQAFTGDFAGDGIKKIGVYRNGTWYIDYNGNGKLDVQDKVINAGGEFGKNAIAVVGDWDGDGIDNIGLYVDGVWNLDTTGDFVFNERIEFGNIGDIPVVGDFSGSGIAELAVYRAAQDDMIITKGETVNPLQKIASEYNNNADAESENRTQRTPFTDAPLHRHHQRRN